MHFLNLTYGKNIKETLFVMYINYWAIKANLQYYIVTKTRIISFIY